MKLITRRFGTVTKNQSNTQTQEAAHSADSCVFAEKVEQKAYELYEKKGCQNGHDLDDWLEAEKIIETEMIAGK